MNVENRNYASIERIRSQLTTGQPVRDDSREAKKTAPTFGDILTNKTNQVKFSKHASKRLETRNIDMSQEQKDRLQNAADMAREKGMRESLVMVDNMAFIVNVRNKEKADF